jgi:hypothetical protein
MFLLDEARFAPIADPLTAADPAIHLRFNLAAMHCPFMHVYA